MDFKTNLETKLEDRLNVLKEKTSKKYQIADQS